MRWYIHFETNLRLTILYFSNKSNESYKYWNYPSKSVKINVYKIFKHESIDRDYNYQLGYLHWKKPIHANCKLIEKKHTQKAVLCNG